MSRIALDTSAYSKMRSNHAGVLEALADAERVYLPAVVLGELEAAFAMGRRARENRVALAEFLDENFVSVVPVDAGVARRYGELFAELRRQGTPIPINDVWIAAATLEVGARLLTFDRDFERITRLERAVLKDPA